MDPEDLSRSTGIASVEEDERALCGALKLGSSRAAMSVDSNESKLRLRVWKKSEESIYFCARVAKLMLLGNEVVEMR